MRWQLGRRSTNIEDRRGAGRVGMSMPGRGGLKVGGLGGVALVVLALLFGFDPSFLLTGGGEPAPVGQGGQAPTSLSPEQDKLKEFMAVVLADTEDTWKQLLPQQQKTSYEEPKLVLFAGETQSACGFAEAATGPFYCPADRKVYLDLDFFAELDRRFGAPGDFAQAYVVAHEIGHHVQTILGISSQVRQMQQRSGERDANSLSVMMELQADCLAGVWAHHAQRQRKILEEGDIEEGLKAASAVGDDTIQKRSRGYVVPDAFTHGSAAQRQRWFVQGLKSGDTGACDTFNATQL